MKARSSEFHKIVSFGTGSLSVQRMCCRNSRFRFNPFCVQEIAERVRNGRGDGITTGPTKRFANVSGRGCSHDEVGEIFGLFENAYAVNADDNLLRLSSFRECKSLKRLSLRRNRLQSVEP